MSGQPVEVQSGGVPSETAAIPRSDVFDIAITGIGLVTPLGLGSVANLERLLAGDSAVRDQIPPGVDASDAIASARCPDFDLSPLLRFPKALKYMSRPVQLAMRAALEAFESSGLQRDEIDPYRLAIYTASGQTGLDYTEFSRAIELAWGSGREPDFGSVGGRPARLIDPYFSLRTLGNGGMALLSTEFGAKGPSGNFVHSETAPALALQAACYDIAEGRADAAIVGGFDSLLSATSLFALNEAGSLAGAAADFGPIVPAEGSAFFILERRSGALARGAGILGEILGIECSLESPIRGSGPSAAQPSERAVRKLVRRLPQECQSFQFAIAPDHAPCWSAGAALGEAPVSGSLSRATGNLGAATAAVELALGLLSARQGRAMSGQSPSAIQTNHPTGIFFSRSWSGQTAAIVARACSTERKVFGACAP